MAAENWDWRNSIYFGKRLNDTWWVKPRQGQTVVRRLNIDSASPYNLCLPAIYFEVWPVEALFHFVFSPLIYFSAFPIVHAATPRPYSGSSTWINRAAWAPTRWGWLWNLQVALGFAAEARGRKPPEVRCVSCVVFFVPASRVQAEQQPVPVDHPALHGGGHDCWLWQLCHVSGQTGDHVQWVSSPSALQRNSVCTCCLHVLNGSPRRQLFVITLHSPQRPSMTWTQTTTKS